MEWSGLRSDYSKEITVLHGLKKLAILEEKPDDFSWTTMRWSANGSIVSKNTARAAKTATGHTVHRYDGVIARTDYQKGQIISRFDLNAEAKPIRRLFYRDGKLSRREYYSTNDILETQEIFDSKGYITETIEYLEGGGVKWHWFYDKGEAVKLITDRKNTRHAKQGPGTYVKQGLDWIHSN